MGAPGAEGVVGSPKPESAVSDLGADRAARDGVRHGTQHLRAAAGAAHEKAG